MIGAGFCPFFLRDGVGEKASYFRSQGQQSGKFFAFFGIFLHFLGNFSGMGSVGIVLHRNNPFQLL